VKIDWTNIPTIKSQRVSLRRYAASDLDAIYEIHADPEVMRYLGGSPMRGLGEAEKFIAKAREGFEQRLSIEWGIARQSDNLLIGTFTFFNLDTAAKRAEIGFSLGRRHWRIGYMHEALQAALGYCFNELDFRRIEADTDPGNLSAIRLLERVGFQKEGYLRERWLVPGQTQDALFYGLLKREWRHSGAGYLAATPEHAQPSLRARFANSRFGRWAAKARGFSA
jgi:RimJ/RimL family protein N-acetyltransferase